MDQQDLSLFKPPPRYHVRDVSSTEQAGIEVSIPIRARRAFACLLTSSCLQEECPLIVFLDLYFPAATCRLIL